MRGRLCRVTLLLIALIAFPFRSPAPLIYRQGEGFTYEWPGEEKGTWQRQSAREQLQVAQDAFDKKNYRLAMKAAKRTVKMRKLSDFAPQAQYLIGRCYEAQHKDEKAFKAYQEVLEKYPKFTDYQDVQKRQFDIAVRYLNGQFYRLFGYVPLYRSWEKTAGLFDKVVKNGPYSPIAPQAQMDIGAAREKQKEYPLAVKAYERAADRYADQRQVAADATFKAGLAYQKEARTADYDQSVAGKAIATFTDFMALYDDDPRVPDAQRRIASLKSEQALGNFRIAQYYEKGNKWEAARIYYNAAYAIDATSPMGTQARQRIEALKRKTGAIESAPSTNAPAK
ncbi:MAG: tetratricopeptide repeat protein [Limisphaerales bacterium]